MTPSPHTSRPSTSSVLPLSAMQSRQAFSWFRFLILLVLLLTQLLTLLGIFWAGRQNSERVVQLQARSALNQLVRVTADSTRSYLQAATHIVKLNRELLGMPNVEADTSSRLLEAMNVVVNSVAQIDGAMIGQPDGSFIFVRRDGQAGHERFTRVIQTQPVRQVTDSILAANGKVTSRQAANTPFDPRTRPWFQRAVANPAAVVWTAPYVFASSRLPGITVSAALPAPDGKMAVVAMDVQLRGLTRFLETLQISPNGRAFIADQQGHAIAASRAWPINVQNRIPLLSEVGDPALQALLEARHTRPNAPAQADALQLYQVDGQPYAAVVQRVQVQPGTTWLVGVYAPESDFTRELRELYQRQLGSILLFMLLSALLAWPLAFGATQPLASLQKQATTDALTGLRNRASFLAHLHDELRQAPSTTGQIGVVILDLDGFKAVNDRFGHGVGDEVLHAIGARLLGAVRAGDTLGRLGGDEFALVVRGQTQEVVKLRVEGLIEDIARRPVQTDDMEHLLGATAGLAFYDRDLKQNASELLSQADMALMRGKKQQKGRVWLSGELGSTLLD